MNHSTIKIDQNHQTEHVKMLKYSWSTSAVFELILSLTIFFFLLVGSYFPNRRDVLTVVAFTRKADRAAFFKEYVTFASPLVEFRSTTTWPGTALSLTFTERKGGQKVMTSPAETCIVSTVSEHTVLSCVEQARSPMWYVLTLRDPSQRGRSRSNLIFRGY